MRFLKASILLATALLTFTTAVADDTRNVKGEARIIAQPTDSRADCERRALEEARADALGREFGWTVGGSVYQQETVSDSGESIYFDQSSSRQVKGEWIADTDVKYEYSLDGDGALIVTCRVAGKARPLSNEAVDYEAILLRNGTTKTYQSEDFRQGDKMYLLFRAPADGYVAVYLVDDRQQAYSILPYSGSNDQAVRVKRNREYVFFSPDHAENPTERLQVDELIASTDSDVERDEVIVVFSPHEFSKALDNYSDGMLPRQLTLTELNKWIDRASRNDRKMSIRRLPMHISNR